MESKVGQAATLKASTLHVPNMEELARLYRKAITANDRGAAAIAEQAALKFAHGEAAIHEANVLAQFINSVG